LQLIWEGLEAARKLAPFEFQVSSLAQLQPAVRTYVHSPGHAYVPVCSTGQIAAALL